MKLNPIVRCSLVASLALMPSIARSQDSTTTIRVNVHVPDSVAHIVDRERADDARFSILSRNGQAQLLLMDTTIVAQMTDRGLAHMSSREATDSIQGTAHGELFGGRCKGVCSQSARGESETGSIVGPAEHAFRQRAEYIMRAWSHTSKYPPISASRVNVKLRSNVMRKCSGRSQVSSFVTLIHRWPTSCPMDGRTRSCTAA